MNETAHTYYRQITESASPPGEPGKQAKALRAAMQFITADLLTDDAVRFPNLFSRLEYLCRRHGIGATVRGHLHQLRIRTNRGANHTFTELQITFAARALAAFVAHVTGVDVPDEPLLRGEIGRADEQSAKVVYTGQHFRVAVTDSREGVLYTTREDQTDTLLLLHKADHPGFEDTFDGVTPGDVLSLIDAGKSAYGDDYCKARLVVFQPDYLLDVSGLAACFIKIAGTQVAAEALWFLNRFSASESTLPLFLGNLVNTFFDAMVSANPPPDFKTLFGASFAAFPMEYVRHFPEDSALVEFMNTHAVKHCANLKRVVTHDLQHLHPPVPLLEPLIEPSFMSPDLGLQGRLDLLHFSGDQATIVELKSGKLPWPHHDHDAVNEGHAAQARMYQMLVNRVLGIDFRNIHVYLLYSSGGQAGTNLRYVVRYVAAETAIIALRNSIVLSERALAQAENTDEVLDVMKRWTLASTGLPDTARIPEWFGMQFDQFQLGLAGLSALQRDYLCAFVTFIAREQWLARVGDGRHRLGHSALWNKDDDAATDSAERLGPMRITQNQLAEDPPRMELTLLDGAREDHDFRRGDICVLFPTDDPSGTAVQRQVIKCYLVAEPDANGALTLGFRNPQHHTELFSSFENWSIEHDYMDQSFTGMQRELFGFIHRKDRMQDLLLGHVLPEPPHEVVKVEPGVNDALTPESQAELRTLLGKAVSAPECFLLVGPPGTGKTSMFLANVIVEAHRRGEELLLLAYTNRAVDEICEAVEQALGGGDHYFRIGSGSAGDPRFEQSLLHRLAGGMRTRKELKDLIKSRKVVVATVSGILSRNDIFELKHFDRIIVDEASQVLEPLLVNILRRARRFILIGDDRQLPAVVQQSPRCNRMITPRLRQVGMFDLRASLFERMLKNLQAAGCDHAWGTLSFQGRMHPQIGRLVGERWYGGLLHPAGRPHQLESDRIVGVDGYLQSRLVFVNGGQRDLTVSRKVNPEEATLIGLLVVRLAEAHGLSGARLHEAIGIIAPYRNQIGRIKHVLAQLNLDGAGGITVDTVERYQGSQRDYIIYGTTVSSAAQLAFLTSNTRTDGEVEVDRKLNVAISRARKQFILVGQRSLLDTNAHYAAVINHIDVHGKVVAGNSLLAELSTADNAPF